MIIAACTSPQGVLTLSFLSFRLQQPSMPRPTVLCLATTWQERSTWCVANHHNALRYGEEQVRIKHLALVRALSNGDNKGTLLERIKPSLGQPLLE